MLAAPNAAYLQTMFAYHHWANQRILDAANGVDIDAQPIERLPSIRVVLVHCASAEWLWRSRWSGVSPTGPLDPADFPDFAMIRARWERETQQLRARAASLSDSDLTQSIAFSRQGQTASVPLWHVLTQVAMHAMQHRAELAAMLTILKRSPGDLDMFRFLREHS